MDCSICGGHLVFLGTLGNLAHHVCRLCGMQSSLVDDGPEREYDPREAAQEEIEEDSDRPCGRMS